MTPKALRELAENLFTKRGGWISLLQEIAENFYPERADFTVTRNLGEDMAAHLTTSVPLLVRRELGDQLGMMLRPTNKAWFHTSPRDQSLKDTSAMRWLQWAEGVQRRAMYDQDAFFNKAMKLGDHDFACFGGDVTSVQLAPDRSHLLFQNWHIKDNVWREGPDSKIDFHARRWRPAISDLIQLFPRGDIDEKIRRRATKEPFAEANILHIVCKAELADANAMGRPRVSIFYDCEHDKVIEVVPIWGRVYIVSRWVTIAGSQYPFSPAAVAGLPEARLLQAMSLTLLEAGEKAANPPLIATKDAVKSDMQLYPGGVTWVDYDYDEKLGAALRALNIDTKGLPLNLEMIQDSRDVLRQCFYLNKLRAFNPTTDPNMTAFQAGQLVQEYIRGALPLFEPMEQERNGQICEEVFDILMRNGAFGSPFDVPQALRGVDIDFKFESPLHDAIDAQKSIKFLEFKQVLAEAIALDPAVAHIPDAPAILRDVAEGMRVPAKWTRTEMQVEESRAAAAEQQQAMQQLQAAGASAAITKDLGAARRDIAEADAAAAR